MNSDRRREIIETPGGLTMEEIVEVLGDDQGLMDEVEQLIVQHLEVSEAEEAEDAPANAAYDQWKADREDQ